MSLSEDRKFLKEKKAAKENIEKEKKKQEKEIQNRREIEREEIKAKHEAAVTNFYKYKDNVKRLLLRKALLEIYNRSIYNMTGREKLLCENLIDQYIEEHDHHVLLRKMKCSRNPLLRCISEKVKEYSEEITQDATADDPGSQVMSKSTAEDFWKDIDKANDVDDITHLIRIRVSNAEEDFINKNQEDKEDIKDVLKQTAARVNIARASGDDDYAEEVEESANRIAKNKIYAIQHEGRKNVFDRMVKNLSKAVLLNENMKAEYTTSNGKLDIDKIVESVRCMYTLLEMVGTICLEDVDNKYIEESIQSIR